MAKWLQKRKRRSFSPEFKAEAVRLCIRAKIRLILPRIDNEPTMSPQF
jgi:transposase-like protein